MREAQETKKSEPSRRTSPWIFFMLVFLLSVPFYVLGAAGGRLPIATFLPMSAIMAFVPMIVALVLVYRENGVNAARLFLGRAFDYRSIKGVGWILAALLLMPLVFVLEYGVLRLSGAAPLGAPFPIATILAFFVMFFVGAVGEELGWQGYAFPGLRERRSALEAGLILGVIWALWHVIPYAQMGRDPFVMFVILALLAGIIITLWSPATLARFRYAQ